MTGSFVVFEARGNAVLKTCDVPEPGADEVLPESAYSVVSAGTERANLLQLPNTVTAESGFPFVPGYCGAGRVIAAGPAVTRLKVGDRVIIAREGRISLLGCTRVSDVPIDFYQHVHRRGVSLIGAHTFTRARQESAPGRWTEHDDYR